MSGSLDFTIQTCARFVMFFIFLFKTIYICHVTLNWRQGKGEQCKRPDFPNCSGHFESPHKTSRSLFLGEKRRWWWWVAGVAPKLNSPRPPAERVRRGGRGCRWGWGGLAAARLPLPAVGLGSWFRAGLGENSQGLPERRPSVFLELLRNFFNTEEFLRKTEREEGKKKKQPPKNLTKKNPKTKQD